MATLADRTREKEKQQDATRAKNPALVALEAATGVPAFRWGEGWDWSSGDIPAQNRRAALDWVLAFATSGSVPSRAEGCVNPFLAAPGTAGAALLDNYRFPSMYFASPPYDLIDSPVAKILKIPYGCGATDYYAWIPRPRLLDLATMIRADVTDEKYWGAVHAIHRRAISALYKARRAPTRVIDEFIVALYRQPDLTGRPLKVPHKGLLEQLVDLFKAAGALFAKIADAAKDGQIGVGEGLEIFGAAAGLAKTATGKVSGEKKKYLQSRARMGYFGPPAALWVQEDVELWELIRDLEI